MTRIRTLPYLGGKYYNAKWINENLPSGTQHLYVEPFAGMANVFLIRERNHVEILNDINSRITNWYKVLRDNPEPLLNRLKITEYSRDVFNEAIEKLEDDDPVIRAWAFMVSVQGNVVHTDNNHSFAVTFSFSKRGGKALAFENLKVKMRLLIKRLQAVQIENKDVGDLLDRIKNFDNTVIYCDPPYYSANVHHYSYTDFDINRISEMLLVQKGKVAISGYGEEWDHLGWRSIEKETWLHALGKFTDEKTEKQKRTEKLWMNYSQDEL